MQDNRFFNRNSLNLVAKWWLDIDKINFLLVFGLIVFGLIVSATSSPVIAERIGVEKLFFVKKQLVFAAVACVILVLISFLQPNQIKIFALLGVLGAIFLLILVLLFGFEIKGAKRWFAIGGFALQPSEFAKTFFVVANAYILQKLSDRAFVFKYGFSALLFFVIAGLLILQPDFGMTMTLAILWACQLFLFGLPMFLVVICVAMALASVVAAYMFLPHVKDRINRFLDFDSANYQLERSIDAFVSGGFSGLGQGNGVVKNFIPDAHTDFVFAVIGEEFGILTCILLILFFAYLVTRIVKRALDEEDMFVYLALFGLMMQFVIQVVVNIGVGLRLFPTKGMTLPFISYGGSSMLAMAICFGLILAFTKKKYHRDVDYGNLNMI